MKKDMSSNAKLSFLERFGYGVGDYAANLVYSAISAFLLVYYTNVIGASAAAAASSSPSPRSLTAYQTLQSEAALTAITTSFAWIPAVTSVLCVVCMLFFDLDKHYDKVVADLAAGKYKD